MHIILDLLETVVAYLRADWSILLFGITLAVLINVYLDPVKFKRFVEKRAGASIVGSILFGTFTPLCACGTMAVILSMLVSALPWGPVMAFLVSSPLTSPSEYVFETAFLGSRFAVAMVLSSVVLGVAAGYLAHQLARRTSFFDNQFVVTPKTSPNQTEAQCQCACGSAHQLQQSWVDRYKLKELLSAFVDLGLKKVLLYFAVFIAVGRLVDMLIPQSLITGLFGASRAYSVPLAATLGLPLYVSGPSALPLLKSFLSSGASEGAILAFMIAGKATGIPVIAGLSTILKKRAILFYVGCVYLGAIAAGFVYQLLV